MHQLATRWRAVAVAAAIATFFVIILSTNAFLPRASAAITVLPPGGSCTEFYLDLNNNGVADIAPSPDDLNQDGVINAQDISAIALTRIEPTKTGPSGTYDTTSVLYLGPDTDANLIPNEPPDQGCLAARSEATGGPEVSNTNPRTDYVNQFGLRPSAVQATLASKVLTVRSCGYSEAIGGWVRQDTFTTISGTGPTAVSPVDAVLYLASGAPSGTVPGEPHIASDPTTCSPTGSFPYNTVGVSYAREATTDNTALPQNTAYGIPADTGATVDTADGKQDDYDGDGCPDWDELDKNFTHNFVTPASTNQHGMDPFNPNDCDQKINSNIYLLATVIGNKAVCTLAQIVGGTCAGGGSYFQCLGTVVDTAGTPQPLALKLACYADSPASVINTNYNSMNIAESVCTGSADDDGDGGINDGCPAAGGAQGEAGGQCGADTADDDGDGRVNDGCPVVSGTGEGSAAALANIGQCYDAVDSDGDLAVNDGCPAVNSESGGACGNAADNDGDTVVNDGCPTVAECGPSPAIYCGDGRASPPPPSGSTFAAPADANWPIAATGTLDKSTMVITIGGCFVGFGGNIFGPNVYSTGTIDLRTGAGRMTLHGHINNLADCNDGSPFPSQGPIFDISANLTIAELGPLHVDIADDHDSDSDGCSDTKELVTTAGSEAFGGKRDPFNISDVYDVNRDGTIDLFTDIFGVAFDFGTSGSPSTDRAAPIPGGNIWNLPSGDGTVDLFNDIFGVAFQFGLDCT